MAMSNAQPEPSMEEILASIRRIISEDGDGEAVEKADPAPGAAAPAAKPVAQQAPATPRSEPRLTQAAKDEGIEMMKKNLAEAMQEGDREMLDETTAEAASKAFQNLSQTVRVSSSSGGGRTLEEIVIEMLRPMVKEWLDANLAAIVEEKVEEEVQRLARRRR
jgi:hypothetical protein